MDHLICDSDSCLNRIMKLTIGSSLKSHLMALARADRDIITFPSWRARTLVAVVQCNNCSVIFEQSRTVEIGAQHLRPLKKSSWSSFPFISPTCSRIQMICFHWKWMIFSCLSCLYTHYFRYLYICWGGRRELIRATWMPSVEWEWRSRSDKSWEFYLEGIMCVYAKKKEKKSMQTSHIE